MMNYTMSSSNLQNSTCEQPTHLFNRVCDKGASESTGLAFLLNGVIVTHTIQVSQCSVGKIEILGLAASSIYT